LPAAGTPSLTRYIDDLQPGAISQRSAGDHVEAKAQRLQLDLGKLPHLEPHGFDTVERLSARLLFQNLENAPAQRYLVHVR